MSSILLDPVDPWNYESFSRVSFKSDADLLTAYRQTIARSAYITPGVSFEALCYLMDRYGTDRLYFSDCGYDPITHDLLSFNLSRVYVRHAPQSILNEFMLYNPVISVVDSDEDPDDGGMVDLWGLCGRRHPMADFDPDPEGDSVSVPPDCKSIQLDYVIADSVSNEKVWFLIFDF